jgi:hypothetical protein
MMWRAAQSAEVRATEPGCRSYNRAKTTAVAENRLAPRRFNPTIAFGAQTNKLFLVILLPTVEPSMIPKKTLPLLVFVNVKSGGCQVRIGSFIHNFN